MLVYDVTNRLSFENLDGWMHEFTLGGGKNAVVAVVANKAMTTYKYHVHVYIYVVV